MKEKLKIQEYLLNNSIERLQEEFFIIIKPHQHHENLYLFKYNQIDSPMSETIVQEARGLILDKSNDWAIVCMTYKKFFNYGEGNAATINWNKAKCVEKVDGSLMQMYFYNGAWCVASSGVPDASGEINGMNITFKELFWRVWKELEYKLPYNGKICYAFELCTPYNKVVVQHNTNDIILHGARDLITLKELDHKELAKINGWNYVKEHPFNTLEGIIMACEKINPVEKEGYVILDNNYNRIKVKSPQYVALSHIKEGCSMKRIVDIIKTNEYEEFLNYFPEFKMAYNLAKGCYGELIKKLIKKYNKIKHIENQKEFALEALKSKCSSVLFSLRNGKVESIKEGVDNILTKNLVQILDLEGIDIFNVEKN